ncbi:MAG: macro domain-containing protein [Bacteroidota bacterium]
MKSIAFPSISTGAYGFPIERASRIAVSTVSDFVQNEQSIADVRFVVFSRRDYDVYAPLFHAELPA